MTPYDDRQCCLGEGPLWHPGRQQLFWFDIQGKQLLTRVGDAARAWDFDEMVSAAGWIDEDHLLVASETQLFSFKISDGSRETITLLESDMPRTRSNDGRADPWGGFWIGTMAKDGAGPVGAFYRYYRGEVRMLYDGLCIPNACCFSPCRNYGYFTDTANGIIKRVSLDPETGWPAASPEVWLDLSGEDWGPDGAVIDANGNFWNAQWGAWRVACYSPDGALLRTVDIDATHTSCPAFGGPDLTTLFCTTAGGRVSAHDAARSSHHGKVFSAPDIAKGQPEHQVIL
ncbi:MAG: SMP-30/gluconolactonase/LRE family protein [Silicimonas sp.]|nr:SMP-30/gluconolactonase/LRE family protein [Silicimonas sp.]